MTWEETIISIRKNPEYNELIKLSYLEENLGVNVERFCKSKELDETLKIFNEYVPKAKKILDLGAGNGVSAVSFALHGFDVVAAEPDKSFTAGCGAIEILKKEFAVTSLNIVNAFGEQIPFEEKIFDIVYIRQAMHHASDLKKFMLEASRVLKEGGLLLTVRDHVIFNKRDKQLFLETHPLQKFYGGENAYTEKEYSKAMTEAGLEIKKILRYYDSVINYFPISEAWFQNISEIYKKEMSASLKRKIGFLHKMKPIFYLYKIGSEFKNGNMLSEKRIPGRMYSFIAIKK